MIEHVVGASPSGDRGLIGKKVMALLSAGGYAQFAVARADRTICLPDDADNVMFAAIPTQGITAWLMLNAPTRLRAGESVLVHGAGGGVGSLAVQIAKLMGAGTVIAAAGSEEKRAFALSLGADIAIDYDQSAWPEDALKATGGSGVDIILESIGGEIFEKNFECFATFGRLSGGPGAPLRVGVGSWFTRSQKRDL